MSKYIDLAEQVNLHVPGTGCHPLPDDDTMRDRRAVLAWLDEHPDQAPGPTTTESDFERRIAGHGTVYAAGYGDALTHHGITVVPDPKPTDVERLTRDIEKFYDLPPEWLASHDDGMAQFLAGRGWTKTPEAGGDGEG